MFFGTQPGSFSDSLCDRLLASVPPPDRLSALDAAFLDLETARAPLHVGWTLKLDGPAPSVAALRRHIDARLDALPRFRRRVRGQQWADDAGFDVARHVHGMTLAAPGGHGELRTLAGRLLGRPLDMDRPLWRLARTHGGGGGGGGDGGPGPPPPRGGGAPGGGRSSARPTTRSSTGSPRCRSRCSCSTASKPSRRRGPHARRRQPPAWRR